MIEKINGQVEYQIGFSEEKETGNDDDVSVFDNYESQYSSSDWEDVEAKEETSWFSKHFVYSLDDGTKITLDDTKDVIIRQNMN